MTVVSKSFCLSSTSFDLMLGLELEPLLHQLRHLWPISSHDLRLWGTVASSPVTGSLGGYARETVVTLEDAWSTRGNCVTLGDAWSTLGDAWSTLGTVLRWGTPGPRWGTVLRWGDAWSTLGKRLVVSVRFSDAGVPEDLSACRL